MTATMQKRREKLPVPQAEPLIAVRVRVAHGRSIGGVAVKCEPGEVLGLTPTEAERESRLVGRLEADAVRAALTCPTCARWFLGEETLARHVERDHSPAPEVTPEQIAARERAEYVRLRALRIEHARKAGEASALALEIEDLSERLADEERRCDRERQRASNKDARTGWLRQALANKEAVLRDLDRRLPYLRRELGIEGDNA